MTKADGEPPRTHCKAIPAELSSSALATGVKCP